MKTLPAFPQSPGQSGGGAGAREDSQKKRPGFAPGLNMETPSNKDYNLLDINGLPEKNQERTLAIAEDIREIFEGILGSKVSLRFASTTKVTPEGGATKIHYLRPGLDQRMPTTAQECAGNPPSGEGVTRSQEVQDRLDRNGARKGATGQAGEPAPFPPPAPKPNGARAMDDAPAKPNKDKMTKHPSPAISDSGAAHSILGGLTPAEFVAKCTQPQHIIDPRDPWAVAKEYLAQLSPPGAARHLHHHRGTFFKWSGNAYIENPETETRAGLYPYLGESFRLGKEDKTVPVKPTASLVSNVIDGLRAATYLDHTIESPAWLCAGHPLAAKDIVACENGLLHLPTGELQKHSPEFFNSFSLDFKFDPKAPEPKQFLEFLAQIWPGDHEAISTLQEWFGYFLTCDTSQQKALLIVGPPRS
jgi:hypothetical protein